MTLNEIEAQFSKAFTALNELYQEFSLQSEDELAEHIQKVEQELYKVYSLWNPTGVEIRKVSPRLYKAYKQQRTDT